MKKNLFIAMIFLLYSSLNLYAELTNPYEGRNEQRADGDAAYIPKDLDECFIELKKILTSEELKEFKSKKEEDLAGYQLSIGKWMRDSWQLSGESRLKSYFDNLGIFHPDDMTDIILTSFHRRLHSKNINLEEQIKHHQDYWNKVFEREFYRSYAGLLEYRKKPEVIASSKISDYNNCEAYRRIVKGGKLFIPFVINEIKKGDFFLNQAMGEITGFDMRATAEAKGVVEEQDISKLWIEWWEKNKDKTTYR